MLPLQDYLPGYNVLQLAEAPLMSFGSDHKEQGLVCYFKPAKATESFKLQK